MCFAVENIKLNTYFANMFYGINFNQCFAYKMPSVLTPTMIANMNRPRGNNEWKSVFNADFPKEKAIDFLSYMSSDSIYLLETAYGKWFDVIVDYEMKERAANIKHRHFMRHGRTLQEDNDAAITHEYMYDYSNAPNFYIYGERLPTHMIERIDPLGALATEANLRKMYNEEQLIQRNRKIEFEIKMTEAKLKAEEINWNGADILIDGKQVDTRHSKAALRKHATAAATYDPNEYTGDYKY